MKKKNCGFLGYLKGKKSVNPYKRAYRQTIRKSMYPIMEDKLYAHIMKKRRSWAIISRQFIKVKALLIAQKLRLDNLQDSNGWMANFLKRRQLCLRRIAVLGGLCKTIQPKWLQIICTKWRDYLSNIQDPRS